MKKYSQQQVQKVLELLKQGKTYKEIEKATGVKAFSVNYYATMGGRKKVARQVGALGPIHSIVPVGPVTQASSSDTNLIIRRLDEILILLREMQH